MSLAFGDPKEDLFKIKGVLSKLDQLRATPHQGFRNEANIPSSGGQDHPNPPLDLLGLKDFWAIAQNRAGLIDIRRHLYPDADRL